MKTELTQTETKLMSVVRDEWINHAMTRKGVIDEKAFEEGIEWLYRELLNLPKPKIVYFDSWLSCVLTIGILKNLPASVGDSVWDSVWDSVGASFSEYSGYIGYGNYGWVSFYDYFSRIGILKNAKFDEYLKLTKSGVFEAYEYKGFVFAIKPPVTIKRDEQGRLHSTREHAVSFVDKSEYFFIHGVAMPWQTWDLLLAGSYTFSDFAKEKNEEIKSACLSFIEETQGSEGLFRFISEHLIEVDTYTDRKDEKYLVGTTGGMNIGVYTLFSGQVNNINIAFVRCYCPSTDRMFFLSVDPSNRNAKDAIASLYRIPKKLKPHIVYIQRQGERFSTAFSEEGKAALKRLSQEEIADLVSISGEEYFSQLTFEF